MFNYGELLVKGGIVIIALKGQVWLNFFVYRDHGVEDIVW